MGTKELFNGAWDLSREFHTGVIKCVFKKPLTLGHPVYVCQLEIHLQGVFSLTHQTV